MNRWLYIVSVLVLTGLSAQAQLFRPRSCPPVAPLYCPPLTDPNATPITPNPIMDPMAMNPNLPPNLENAFAQANPRGGTSASSFNESFMGDFGGYYAKQRIQVGTLVTPTFPFGPPPTFQPVNVLTPIYRDVYLPLGTRYNGILITDNDSPRPTDRAYFGYNHYSGVSADLNGGNGSNMNRETMGFEKTILGGNGSIGMRLPFIQTDTPFGLGQRNVGDLSVLLKYAFYNNLDTGDVASVGMVLTTPTGSNNYLLADGSNAPNSVIYQPWVGGISMLGSGYVQGISSIVASGDSREPTLFNNSLSAGYFLYRNATDRLVQSIIPTVEVHVRTPLNHRNTSDLIFYQDQVNLTGGIHFRTLGATISPAINVPVAGPRAWNVEAMVWVNVRF